jgi:hypothetical protein
MNHLSAGNSLLVITRRHSGERVHDAVAVEAVEYRRAFAQGVELGRPTHVGVREERRRRARVLGCVEVRIRSTLSGFRVSPPWSLSVLPHSLTISAATPAACGAAIDVPCRGRW